MLAAEVVTRAELAGAWSLDPTVVAALGLAAAVYGRGVGRLGRRGARLGRRRRDVAFYGALVVLAAALVSPLEALSGALFSAHMVQHLLLMTVAAPLLAYARPGPALTAGLPRGARQAVREATAAGLPAAARALGHPVAVWTVGAAALWAWHMPSLYQLALADEVAHAAEHASFLGAGLLFWSAVVRSGSRRGMSHPAAVLLVFATGLQGAALGAVLVFAAEPLYPAHAAGAAAWGVSPIGDQQLAGALMWVPPMVLYLVVMAALLARWFSELERQAPARPLVSAGDRP